MRDQTVTNSLGLGKGRGRSKTASITLKMALLAPMQRASVRTAITLNAGDLVNIRRAYFHPVNINCDSLFYSVRNASTGSTRRARLAGNKQAASAVVASNTVAPASNAGLCEET